MKIKFIKEYRALFGESLWNCAAHSVGAVLDVIPLQAQWLIDNGFAEKVDDTKGQWKPKFGEVYYFLGNTGKVCVEPWLNDELDEYRYSMGECFKTEKAAEDWRGYLMAIATVSHDEGFMRKSGGGFGWPVIEYMTNIPGVDDISGRRHAGEFYFDTREHALNSAMNHTREWQTIINYDWSRE